MADEKSILNHGWGGAGIWYRKQDTIPWYIEEHADGNLAVFDLIGDGAFSSKFNLKQLKDLIESMEKFGDNTPDNFKYQAYKEALEQLERMELNRDAKPGVGAGNSHDGDPVKPEFKGM